MQFFSGFSLQNEESFFKDYIDSSLYCVCGFNYGAIQALAYTKEQLSKGKRIDRLQLLSPAFFQTKSEKFKRLQLLAFSKNKQQYIKQFIDACFFPYKSKNVEIYESSKENLEELLNYEWILSDLLDVKSQGVVIEVYLGGADAIIDVDNARDFFLDTCDVTYIKNANHFLQIQ